MGTISLEGVEKWFDEVQVIKGIDLAVAHGEFVIFVGPSGCGKSTLLRLISGLEEATVGKIIIDGKDVTALPPAGRGLAMVFQSYALYPHMSVRENIAFPLRMAGLPKSEIDQKVAHATNTLQLDKLLDRRPKALSGGQRQRVAIGRAIVRDPGAFLFDEPLSNLDAALRVEMRFQIAKLHQQLGATMVYVTHDQVEAMTLADKIVVLRAGVIEQVGSPLELYDRPANLFVAQFIGSPKMNVMPCAVESGGVRLPGHNVVGTPTNGSQVTKVGVRPEHIAVTGTADGHCKGTVEVAEHLGSDSFLYVSADNLGILTVRSVGGSADVRAGDEIGLRFDESLLHLFTPDDLSLRAH